LIEVFTSGFDDDPGESLPSGDRVCVAPITPIELSGSAVGFGRIVGVRVLVTVTPSASVMLYVTAVFAPDVAAMSDT
jgi:hypothetical protein